MQPLICGGQQESGLRGGTSNVAGDMMIAKSLRLALEEKEISYKHVKSLFNYLYENISTMDNVMINSSLLGSPYIFSFSVLNKKPEVILNSLSAKEIYVSTRSACSSKKVTPSYVIEALYSDEKRASTTIRISMSKYNTMHEIETFVRELKNILLELKEAK